MTDPSRVAFLIDIDNTLVDNDQVQDDLDRHITDVFDADAARSYWAIFENLRERLGYADYLGAIEHFRLDCSDEVRAQGLAAFLLDYPFADRLYRGALDAVAHLSRFGTCVVVSDGDVVLQPRKIERSGVARAVGGRVLIYVHKERMLEDVERRFPAQHYVMIEDKLRVLDGVQRHWRDRVTTVLVRQGHYANDPAIAREYPPARIELNGVGELCSLGLDAFLPPPAASSSKPATATE